MIKSIVERQLRGKLALDWRTDGLVAHITVPNTEYQELDPQHKIFGRHIA